MELGNLLFGNSRGDFPIKNRKLVHCREWQKLLEICKCDGYGFTEDKEHETDRGGYENDIVLINPYYWGNDDAIADLPNFVYKPTGLEISWYKYPFRDSYMNQELTDKELKQIWRECCNLIRGTHND